MDAGHAQRDQLAGASDHRDGLFDLGSLIGGEVVEVVLDAMDQVLDSADLLFGRHGFGLGPGVEVGGGEEAFAVAEQVVQVGGQVG